MTNAWQETIIKSNRGQNLYCRYYYAGESAANILYIQTPLASVSGMLQQVYVPLAHHGYNVFAIDFSGVGKSSGTSDCFSVRQLVRDINLAIAFISKKNDRSIFLYASTGIGGIIGQYYASRSTKITALTQYGVFLPGDLSPMKIPSFFAHGLLVVTKYLSKIVPRLSVKLPPPKYTGKNAKLENAFYSRLKKENPDIFRVRIGWALMMLEIMSGRRENSRWQPLCPTLVIKPLHDRYYPADFIDRYYDRLSCKKELYSVDDIHSSYYFHAAEICAQVSDWFRLYQGISP